MVATAPATPFEASVKTYLPVGVPEVASAEGPVLKEFGVVPWSTCQANTEPVPGLRDQQLSICELAPEATHCALSKFSVKGALIGAQGVVIANGALQILVSPAPQISLTTI